MLNGISSDPPLDKNPGLRPIGVVEVLRRIIGKSISSVLKEDIKQFGSTHYVFRSTYETEVLKRDGMDTPSYTIWEHRSLLRSFNEYKNYHDTLNPEDAGSSDVDLMWDFLQERD